LDLSVVRCKALPTRMDLLVLCFLITVLIRCSGFVLAASAKPSQDDVSDEDSDLDELDKPGYQNWQHHTVSARAALEMPHDHAPWTPLAKLTGCPKMERTVDIIDVEYYAWLKRLTSDVIPQRPRFVVDISQGVESSPWSEEPRTQTQRSVSYMFALDRVMDADDLCLCNVVHTSKEVSGSCRFLMFG
jgi:hypothetical protein